MRMSSGASVAYEKPRSGRSSCIDRDAEVEQDRVRLDAVRRRAGRGRPRSRRAGTARATPARACEAVEVAAGGRVAVDRDQLAAPAQVGREQARVTSGAERRVDDGLARRDARSSRTSSARTGMWSVALFGKTFGNKLSTPFACSSRCAARWRDPRSRRGRRRRDHGTSRSSFAWRTSGAGRCTLPCLSGLSSAAPPKKRRWSIRRVREQGVELANAGRRRSPPRSPAGRRRGSRRAPS